MELDLGTVKYRIAILNDRVNLPSAGPMKRENHLQTRGMELGRKGIFSVVQNGQVSILFLCKKLILGVFLSRQYGGTRSSYSTKCIPDQDMASTVVASPLYRKAWPYARELPSSLLQHPVKPRSLFLLLPYIWMSYSEPGYAPMAMASTLHRNHRKTTHLRENHLLVLEKYPTTYNTRNSLH